MDLALLKMFTCAYLIAAYRVDKLQALGVNGCQGERFDLEPDLLAVNWELEVLNITWCLKLSRISKYTVHVIEEETDRREDKGCRCCLGTEFIQFHAALQI